MKTLVLWALRIKAFWEKEWKYGVTALAGGILVCVLWSGVYAANIQRGIADGVVRFHVLANSDTTADQNLKLDVRDAVLSVFGKKLEGCSSKGESMALLAAYKEEIRQTAAAEIARQGYDYPVSVSLVREDFPEKTYGNLVFPAGVYDAVRIEIGEAKGHNWWCVLYPNMCFRGSVYEVVEDEAKENLKEVLTPDEYESIFDSGKYEIKLKILDIFR